MAFLSRLFLMSIIFSFASCGNKYLLLKKRYSKGYKLFGVAKHTPLSNPVCEHKKNKASLKLSDDGTLILILHEDVSDFAKQLKHASNSNFLIATKLQRTQEKLTTSNSLKKHNVINQKSNNVDLAKNDSHDNRHNEPSGFWTKLGAMLLFFLLSAIGGIIFVIGLVQFGSGSGTILLFFLGLLGAGIIMSIGFWILIKAFQSKKLSDKDKS